MHMNVCTLDWLELCVHGTALLADELPVFESPYEDYSLHKCEMQTSLMKRVITIVKSKRTVATVLCEPRSLMDGDVAFIKVSNETLYSGEFKVVLKAFLSLGYVIGNITRLDLACDSRNPEGLCVARGWADLWADFVAGRLRCKYHKRYRVFGDQSRGINSISWSTPTSAVGLKSYDKTLELFAHDKPYIREWWEQQGFRAKRDEWHVWRMEVSVRVLGATLVDDDGVVIDLSKYVFDYSVAFIRRMFFYYFRRFWFYYVDGNDTKQLPLLVDDSIQPAYRIPQRQFVNSGRTQLVLANHLRTLLSSYDLSGNDKDALIRVVGLMEWLSFDYRMMYSRLQAEFYFRSSPDYFDLFS